MSASVNLPLHHKSRSSLLALAHLGCPGKTAEKRLWRGCGGAENMFKTFLCVFWESCALDSAVVELVNDVNFYLVFNHFFVIAGKDVPFLSYCVEWCLL